MSDNVIKVDFSKPEPEDYWQCNCGGVLFYVTKQGCVCSLCEKTQVFPDD